MPWSRYRGSTWARRQARLMLETLARITRDDATWDVAALDYHRRLAQPELTVKPDVSNHGRLIEALVWFYQATGEPLAYELAERYAGFHLARTVSADGRFPESSTAAHTHSYLGTLRGLWLWGMLTGQREYLQRVADTYRVTVPAGRAGVRVRLPRPVEGRSQPWRGRIDLGRHPARPLDRP